MGNAGVRDALTALEARVDAGDVTIDEVGPAFERLTCCLIGISKPTRPLCADG